MKAIVWTKYGSPDGLQLREVPKPAPQEGEVLIRVHAATVSTPDTELRRLKFPLLLALGLRLYLGLLKPARKRILGSEFAGEIVSAGKAVTRYRPGDPVFGYTALNLGTYAEYLCLPEDLSGLGGVFALKPANLTYEEAATLPFGGLEARHSLLEAQLQRGQQVLIVGAGGSIGTAAVQLARHTGAEVTAVDMPGKLELLRALGADHVLDAARADFTHLGQAYDFIYDTVGVTSFSGVLSALKGNGTYLNGNAGLVGMLRRRPAVHGGGKKALPWTGDYSAANLLALKELAEAGALRPVIDRTYPLEQVPEAHRYVDSGQKKGNVVVTFDPLER